MGAAAREMRVRASGATSVSVWTVIYHANGYVGAITLVGPATTRKELESIAWKAYKKAERTLR
jgi:hypothetical protein